VPRPAGRVRGEVGVERARQPGPVKRADDRTHGAVRDHGDDGDGKLEPPPPDAAAVMPVTVATMTSPVWSASLVTDRVREPFRLLDTETVARMLAVSEEWVRGHAAELDAIRVGDAPKGALRFDGAWLRAALDRRRIDRRKETSRRRAAATMDGHRPCGRRSGCTGLVRRCRVGAPGFGGDANGGVRGSAVGAL
jgi:hypothetical protein